MVDMFSYLEMKIRLLIVTTRKKNEMLVTSVFRSVLNCLHRVEIAFWPLHLISLNLIIPPICILLKLDYAKFGVSNVTKTFGGWLDPPLGKGRVKKKHK